MAAWQPEIDAGRCVLARLDRASCRACIDACPRGAWQLTDEALVLDTESCDGCGLCVPACPESAIPMPFRPACRHDRDNRLLLAACEKALPQGGEGVLPCLYGLGTGELLAAWQQGVRFLVLVPGECATCPRNRRETWSRNLAALNAALAARRAAPLSASWQTAEDWQDLLALPRRPAASRRDFLRGALAGLSDAALKDDVQPTGPAGMLLPPGAGLLPWAIRLDREACTACLVCTRLCAHGALVFSEGERGVRLQVHSLSCTGCRLCLDVCDPGALQLEAWQETGPQSLALESRQCPRCRAGFHVPAGTQAPALCPTCAGLDRPDPRRSVIG